MDCLKGERYLGCLFEAYLGILGVFLLLKKKEKISLKIKNFGRICFVVNNLFTWQPMAGHVNMEL